MSRRRARGQFAVFVTSVGLSGALAALSGCEWLSGIRDLPARPADAAPEASAVRPVEPVDARPDVVDASLPVIVPVVPDGGKLGVVLARHLALGSTHSCALRDAGKVFCWGGGASGQLGVGGPAKQSDARPVPGIANAVSIVAGSGHSCALDKEGHVSCWGRAEQGQLGGQPSESGSPVSVDVKNVAAIQLAAGTSHTCALLVTGRVRCWGDNGFGQLGNGTRTGGPTPVEPQSLDAVAAIVAGGFFTCAVKTGGAAYCWGDNGFGQLGDRTTTPRPTPVNVRDLTFSPREGSLGQATSCVVAAGGTLTCWGKNRLLGDSTPQGIVVPFPGSPAQFLVPTAAGDDAGTPPLLVSVATGATHACGRTASDTAVCWGSNVRSQLGMDTDGGPVAGYHEVAQLFGTVQEVAVGLSHSCAIARSGVGDQVECWGNNESAQLGAPASEPRAKPALVRFVP